MKIAITGANGQLGHDLVTAFNGHQVVPLTRSELDITQPNKVRSVINELRPDVVINCAAWTAVDECEGDPALARLVNGEAAGWIAESCADVDSHLIHISTDYVFNGIAPTDQNGQSRGYYEDDPIDPINAYGESKALGESLVTSASCSAAIVRVAWLHGLTGKNFARTILATARKSGTVKVVTDQVGTPSFTFDIAPHIRTISEHRRSGVFHLASTGMCSWYEFAQLLINSSGVKAEVVPTTSTEFVRPARRPAWSVLNAKQHFPTADWRINTRKFGNITQRSDRSDVSIADGRTRTKALRAIVTDRIR